MKKLGSQIIDFKRMIRQYEFFIEDLNDLKEMQSEINSDFSSAIAGLKRPDLFENKKVESLANEADASKNESEEPERDPLFKKLFRKMVVKCHPDRLPTDISDSSKLELKSHYENAIKANDDYNWALLISTAIKLEIELTEEYYDHVESLKEESLKVQKEIEAIQSSIAWKWYHAEEDQKDKILSSYVKHMERVIKGKPKAKFLGIGHPRTGTGYTSKLMSSWGLDIGHETLGKDGIVAWQLAVDRGPWPWMDDFEPIDHEFLIYNVRNPKYSIPSIVYTEDTKNQSINFRRSKGRVKTSTNRIEQAILSILRWDQLVTSKKPDFIYRVEDQEKELFEFVSSKVDGLTFKVDGKGYNNRSHNDLNSLAADIKSARADLKAALNEFCDKYGYDRTF